MPIPNRKNIEDVTALTPMQEGMLFHYLKNPQSNQYIEQLCLELSGLMDYEIFKKAWNTVVQTNEMLRTIFNWEKTEKPVQIILKTNQPDIYLKDFSSGTSTAVINQLEAVKAVDRSKGFDLHDVPFRITLCKTAPDQYTMIITNHHIIYDGWSNGIILKEFFQAHDALSRGQKPSVRPKTKFKEFIKWCQQKDTEMEKRFWKDYLSPPQSEPGIRVPRVLPRQKMAQTSVFKQSLPKEIHTELETIANRYKLTPAVMLYTAWGILVQQYHQSADIIFDTTVSGRSAKIKGIEDMVGLFINTLPLRFKTTRETMPELPLRIYRELQQREKVEHTSVALIKEYLEAYGSHSLFDSVVVIENYPLDKRLKEDADDKNEGHEPGGTGDSGNTDTGTLNSASALAIGDYSISGGANYDLTVIITLFNGIDMEITYNREMFDNESVNQLYRHFVDILHSLVRMPETGETVSSIKLSLDDERERLIMNLEPTAGVQSPGTVVYAAPRDEIETTLTEVWATVLNIEKEHIGIDHNFFEFGGHSLKATLLTAAIHEHFHVKTPLAEIFNRPTIRELAQFIRESGKDTFQAFPIGETADHYPLSSVQHRFYLLQQADLKSKAYNAPYQLLLEGEPDKERLEDAFRCVIDRHDSLRTGFVYKNGSIVQEVHPQVDFSITEMSVPAAEGIHTGKDTLPDILQPIVNSFIRPFDLTRPPLLRVGLVKVEKGTFVLICDIHHIISDGSSVNILIAEFMAAYAGHRLPEQKYQYRDFALWQNSQLAHDGFKEQEEYWLEQFAGELPVLDLPLDFPRPPVQSFAGDRINVYFPVELREDLDTLARETGTTFYMVLAAALGVLLGKYTGLEDIIIGSPIAGRHHKDLDNVFGVFVEMIAIRIFPQLDKIFADYLQEVKNTTLKSYENQAYPFGELKKKLLPEDNLSRNPLFDVMLTVQNQGRLKLEIEDLKVSALEIENKTSKMDLNLEVYEEDRGTRVELEYCTALFKQQTIQRFFHHFQQVLEAVSSNRHLALSAIDIMTETERCRILEDFNNTETDSPSHLLVHELFEQQVAQNGDRVALKGYVHPGSPLGFSPNRHITLTYIELNRQAEALAALLRKKGVTHDTIVGLMVERSLEMVAGLFGILKAGGAYFAISTDSPAERLDYLCKDSNLSIILTTRAIAEKTNGFKTDNFKTDRFIDVIYLEEILYQTEGECTTEYGQTPGSIDNETSVPSRQSNLAYVLYTSGSTGRPKGVAVEHRNVMNLLTWFCRTFHITSGTPVLQLTEYTFDPSVLDFFGVLGYGGTLHLTDKEFVLNRDIFRSYVERHSIEILNFVTSMLVKLLSPGKKLAGVRAVICGAERLEEAVRDAITGVGYQLYNDYGPTETTVDCLSGICSHQGGRVTIGKPIANTHCYILDRRGYLVPIGIAGELCIAGDGVARGYINNPEFTAQRFVNRHSLNINPEAPAHSPSTLSTLRFQTVYKTGDLARWLPDGNVEFMGRLDRQVKIRGYRVELGEIENRLMRHRCIREAVVVDFHRAEGGKMLCAYYVKSLLADEPLTAPELREYLARDLPDYMVPTFFIPVDEIPLNPNGKLDRTKLPKPSGDIDTGVSYIEPKSETEQKLAAIWQDVLNLGRIGTQDNFFDSGGNSIIMIQSLVRIREDLEKDVSLKTFFQNPTIEKLSRAIETGTQNRSSDRPETERIIKPVSRDRHLPLSFPQERIWFLEHLYDDYSAYYVPRAIRIKGSLEPAMLERVFTEIIRRHEILRTAFPETDGKPGQVIFAPYHFNIPIIDYTGKDHESQEAAVMDFIRAQGRERFDLEHGPLIRAHLLKLADEEHIFVLCEHHLVHDGWTQGVLLAEFIALYTAFIKGEPSPLPPLPIQYADFAVWQRDYFQGDVMARHLAYWQGKLDGLPPLLELPADRPRPPVMSGAGGELHFHVPATLGRELIAFSRARGVTLFMTMLAVFKAQLYRYTGVDDLCVGIGIAGRLHKETEGLLGMLINSLALRTRVPGNISFEECLERVKTTCLEAYEYEETPLEKVVEVLRPERSLSYTPLFQILFSFMDVPMADFSLPGLELSNVAAHNRTSKFDLNIIIVPGDERDIENEILMEFEYNSDIFDETTIQQYAAHYLRLMQAVVENPNRLIHQLPLLDDEERENVLSRFNQTDADFPHQKTLHQLFVEQAEKTPDQPALILPAQRATKSFSGGPGGQFFKNAPLAAGGKETPTAIPFITYAELNALSDDLAMELIDKGVTPDTIVGLMLERSMEMMIAILGILKAGGAYLPIDPNYPEERIRYMLNDSHSRLLVTDKDIPAVIEKEISTVPPAARGAFLKHPRGDTRPPGPPEKLLVRGSFDDLAYVIYTSGSTGVPKGTAVEHQSVVNVLFDLQRRYPCHPSNEDNNYLIYLLKTNYMFDVSITELFGWYMAGGRLAILETGKEADPSAIADTVETCGVTHINFVPSMFNVFADVLDETHRQKLNCLEYVFLAGEALLPDTASQLKIFNPRTRFENLYGPTEATVYASGYSLSQWDGKSSIPIGKPLNNVQLYILDTHGNPQPPGIPGELCIAGTGLARGYLNNPELTNRHFAPLLTNQKFCGDPRGGFFKRAPWPPEGRRRQIIYKTGDRARWLADGNIQFLGRMDHQVKLRGFRIELGEIESLLKQQEDVREAVVIDREDENGGKFLCAYIVPRDSAVLEPIETQVEAGNGEKIGYFEIPKDDGERLSEYLARSLPDYMIPSYYVQLAAIPMTGSGKIDRKTLAAVPVAHLVSQAEYEAPRNQVEKDLVSIWETVLARQNIGIADPFFSVGGDSIKAIQVTARMKVAGYKVDVKDLYRYSTISRLAPQVQKPHRVSQQSLVTGPVKLTPVQAWFFHKNLSQPQHFNQAVMIHSDEALDQEALSAVFRQIQRHHDALRLVFRWEDGHIVQVNEDDTLPLLLSVFDLRGQGDALQLLEKEVAVMQSEFDLTRGPLMRVGLFHLDDGDRLLIIIHHLVIDGISWRILFEDIEALYRQYLQGVEPQSFSLPLKTDSYQYWADALSRYADSHDLLKQKAYWSQLESQEVSDIPRDFTAHGNYNRDVGSLQFYLSEEDTANLLTRVHDAFSTHINDLLLTALGIAYHWTFGCRKLLLALEGHGREDIIEEMDINRTVGWFTSIYPVVLDLTHIDDWARLIKEIKESLHRVPDKGVGYSILKYLTDARNKIGMTFQLKPTVVFNYLGQVDGDFGSSMFRMAEEPVGPVIGLENEREHDFEISGIVVDKRLRISIIYNKTHYKTETVEALSSAYREALEQIISYCMGKEDREITASDFGLNDMSVEEFDDLYED